MKKQFHIHINDKEKFIIDFNENEAVSIHISNNPYSEKNKEPPTVMHIYGNRWHDDEMDILEWKNTTLNKNDKITIQIQDSKKKPSKIDKDDLYISPEEECSFCHKKKSEVKHLIAAEFMSHICDACIKECAKLIEEKENKYKR
jgi:hypothetical protein